VHSLLKLKAQNRAVRARGLKWRVENEEWLVWSAVHTEDRKILRTDPSTKVPPVQVRRLHGVFDGCSGMGLDRHGNKRTIRVDAGE